MDGEGRDVARGECERGVALWRKWKPGSTWRRGAINSKKGWRWRVEVQEMALLSLVTLDAPPSPSVGEGGRRGE